MTGVTDFHIGKKGRKGAASIAAELAYRLVTSRLLAGLQQLLTSTHFQVVACLLSRRSAATDIATVWCLNVALPISNLHAGSSKADQ